jgi:hypothetical protein
MPDPKKLAILEGVGAICPECDAATTPPPLTPRVILAATSLPQAPELHGGCCSEGERHAKETGQNAMDHPGPCLADRVYGPERCRPAVKRVNRTKPKPFQAPPASPPAS